MYSKQTTACPQASSFLLSRQQLLDVARELQRRTRKGLSSDGAEIQCLPTYLPVQRATPSGRAMVLDLGGSHLRAAVVRLEDGAFDIECGPIETSMPWKRNQELERERYLGVQAELLEGLDETGPLPLGYCFSYPARPTPDRDAKLLSWTKEICIPNTVGNKVGRLLLEFLHRRGRVRCSAVTVINDTVASLLAGRTRPPKDAGIGLIVGTGTNMATFVSPRRIPKLSARAMPDAPLPVNLESGNFDTPHRTREDRMVDEASENPGRQRFEKAVSGAYLGRVMQAACPEADLDAESGAEALVRLAHPDREPEPRRRVTAGRILLRSARLTAAAAAGLIGLLHAENPLRTVRIVAEGGLYWSDINGIPAYAQQVERTVCRLLAALEMPEVAVAIERIPDANLVGAAVAALTP